MKKLRYMIPFFALAIAFALPLTCGGSAATLQQTAECEENPCETEHTCCSQCQPR